MSCDAETTSLVLNIEKCSLVLLDVAGTTTSISFVKDTLFPFVVSQAETFLKEKWEEEPIKDCLNLIKEESDLDLAAAVEKVKTLTQEESSNKGLKTLQGLIYRAGYEKGDIKAHIFEDVPSSLESWAKNRRISIYSTGSVESQKLLFSHTVHGDVSGHIFKYFDQSVGLKTEAESYKNIAKELELAPEEIVFITDDVKEATAAKSGGVTAVLIKREGNPELNEDATKEFVVISSFKDLGLDKTAKRKIEEGATEEAPPSKLLKTDTAEETGQHRTESVQMETIEEEKEETKSEETEKPNEINSIQEKTDVEKTETGTNDVEMKETEINTKDAEMKEEEKVESEETGKQAEKEVDTETKTATEEKTNTETATGDKEETKTIQEEAKTTEPEANAQKESKVEAEAEAKKDEIVENKAAEETPKEDAATTAEEKIEAKDATEKSTKEVEGKNAEDKDKEEATVEEKPTEEAEAPVAKTEEKENNSELANGVENGKEEKSEETTADEGSVEESELKVKKLEETAESKTVSVEV